jgi:hypothetical protein
MTLAVGVLRWSYLYDRAMAKISDMPGPFSGFTLLMSINAPVALVRSFLYRYRPGYWDEVILITEIGLFWYWIALNILRWRERKSVVMFTWRPLRIAGDLLIIAGGVFLGWFSSHIVDELSFRPWQEAVPSLIFISIWSFSLIFFFGRDLIHCVFQRNHHISNTAQD